MVQFCEYEITFAIRFYAVLQSGSYNYKLQLRVVFRFYSLPFISESAFSVLLCVEGTVLASY